MAARPTVEHELLGQPWRADDRKRIDGLVAEDSADLLTRGGDRIERNAHDPPKRHSPTATRPA